MVLFVLLAACGREDAAPAKTVEPTAVAAPSVNLDLQLMLLGSSADVLTASANLLILDSAAYSPAQFAADSGKARAEAEDRFKKMFSVTGSNAKLDQAVREAAVAYIAFVDDVRPRSGEPVSLWQKRTSEARSSYDRAAAAVKVELLAAK